MITWFISLLLVLQSKSDNDVTKPNLIIVNIQQLGWGDIGLYSPWRDDTPSIDTLAQTGVILDHLYSETSSSASHAALLTGILPAAWGFYGSNNAESTKLHPDSGFSPPDDLDLISHKLSNHGYTSEFIGRWHLGQRKVANPVNFGFRSFFGTVSDRDMKYDDLWFPNVGLYRNENIVSRLYEDNGYLGDLENEISNLTKFYKDHAERFLETTQDPFYLHLSLDCLAHPPYRSEAYVNSTSRGTPFSDALKELDDLVGDLVKMLKNTDKFHSTMIVLAADSTAMASRFIGGSNSPFSGGVGDSTEGGVRVPAVISFPAHNFHESRSKQVMNLPDLHTTILSMMGLNISPCGTDECVTHGMDMTDHISSGTTVDRTVPIYRGRTLMALRVDRYKVHRVSLSSYTPGQFLEALTSYTPRNLTNVILYDVIADPSERFFIGDGFAINSARYVEAMPRVQKAMDVILEEVKMTGGLLNECDVAYREWAPPGCARCDVCLNVPESKLKMCYHPPFG